MKLLAVPGLGHPLAMAAEGLRESDGGGFHHKPVLLEEIIHYLAPGAGKTVVDATLGGAGHTLALLERGAGVIGIERDPEALAYVLSKNDLESYGEAFVSRRANFADIAAVVGEVAPRGVDGILLDLGVSSHQLDTADRGFSLRADGPLDMRMDPGEQLTAAEIVNTWEEGDLARIFRELGDEKRSRGVARAIVKRRQQREFERTLDLADCVAGAAGRGGKIHPATRVFQALRMTVNRELESLEAALEAAPALLRPGGRLAVISFHSGEDRIVKRFMRSRSALEIDRPEWPAPRENPDCVFRLLTRRALVAGEAEVRGNPRSRSAKLRVVERLGKEEG